MILKTVFTESEILERIEYFKENINAIECFLQSGKINLDDIMLYILYLGVPLESVNDDFNRFNNETFKKNTRYACKSEKIEAIYKILCRLQHKLDFDIANDNCSEEVLYVYNASLYVIYSMEKHLQVEINEINEMLEIQHKNQQKHLSKIKVDN